jgi:hypothetical protein
MTAVRVQTEFDTRVDHLLQTTSEVGHQSGIADINQLGLEREP